MEFDILVENKKCISRRLGGQPVEICITDFKASDEFEWIIGPAYGSMKREHNSPVFVFFHIYLDF